MPVPLTCATKLVISVDVEDWPQSTWDHSLDITARAAHNTERLLEILARHGTRATMFVLGKFAERFPHLVRRIAKMGHEVASHGHGHVEIFRQSPKQFHEDVRRAKNFLEDLIGQPVLGYRAPDFSIVSTTIWALDILAECGFQYDSSIFPAQQRRYGIAEWPTHPVRVRLSSNRSIVEFPIAVVEVLGRRWGVAGGGYHRLLPWQVIRWAIREKLSRGEPFMAYCHPYEFDAAEFAALDLDIPLTTRLHQGLGRRGFQAKFERMLTTFDGVRASSLLVEKDSMPVYTKPLHNLEGIRP
jgi:polysaccharide deacetylase family protein (PEP-CTERM system associated)